MPWLVHHSALLIDICRIGDEGRTPYERRDFSDSCQNSNKASGSEGRHFQESRSLIRDGRMDCSQASQQVEERCTCSQRCTQVGSFNRRPEEGRWNQEELGGVKGTPWEPIPGRGGIEVKSTISIRRKENTPIPGPIPQPSARDVIPRRIYIRRQDVLDSKY